MKKKDYKEIYVPVTWPDVQELMGKDGFDKYSYLINDDKGYEDFGDSAYFVNLDWLNEVDKGNISSIY